MFPPKKTAPAKKVWRISEKVPKGEWVDKVTSAVPTAKKPTEGSDGTWVMSSHDLLDGTDVTEDALPGDLFDELFAPTQDAPKKTGQ